MSNTPIIVIYDSAQLINVIVLCSWNPIRSQLNILWFTNRVNLCSSLLYCRFLATYFKTLFNILIISMCSTFLLSECVQHSYYLNVFNILIIWMCSTFLLSQCFQHSYYLNVFNILIISMCSTFLLSQLILTRLFFNSFEKV
jgi:hypothetical protein